MSVRVALITQRNVGIETLLGEKLESIHVHDNNELVVFKTSDGDTYAMHHEQSCCENVFLADVCGDWDDLLGADIKMAAEENNSIDSPGDFENQDEYMWTFYKLGTIKGYVTLRWYGTSNGYYSIGVQVDQLKYGIRDSEIQELLS